MTTTAASTFRRRLRLHRRIIRTPLRIRPLRPVLFILQPLLPLPRNRLQNIRQTVPSSSHHQSHHLQRTSTRINRTMVIRACVYSYSSHGSNLPPRPRTFARQHWYYSPQNHPLVTPKTRMETSPRNRLETAPGVSLFRRRRNIERVHIFQFKKSIFLPKTLD